MRPGRRGLDPPPVARGGAELEAPAGAGPRPGGPAVPDQGAGDRLARGRLQHPAGHRRRGPQGDHGTSVPSPASTVMTTSIRRPLESSANRPISSFRGTGSGIRPSSPVSPYGHPRRASRTSAPAAGLPSAPRNSTVRVRWAGKRTVCDAPVGARRGRGVASGRGDDEGQRLALGAGEDGLALRVRDGAALGRAPVAVLLASGGAPGS